MKKLMLSTAILGAVATTSFAQTADVSSPFRTEADPMIIAASEFIGMRVYASEAAIEGEEYAGLQDGWEDIGEINDVLLARDGSVDSVLVDIGGFLGIGERQVAVDMGAIRLVADSATAEDLDDFFLVMNANRAMFEEAPAYIIGEKAATAEPVEAPAKTEMETATTEPMTPASPEATAPAAPEAQAEATVPADQPQELSQTAELTAEELQGAPVYDAQNAWIGEVSEIVLTAEGEVSEAVIDVGGFLGIGAKPVALDLSEVEIQRENGSDDIRIQVALTKEQLEALPEHAG